MKNQTILVAKEDVTKTILELKLKEPNKEKEKSW